MELFGHYAGHTAFRAGIAAEADAILIPEIAADMDAVYEHCKTRYMARIDSSDINAGTYLILASEDLKDASGKDLVDETGMHHGRIHYMETAAAIEQRYVDLKEVAFYEHLGYCFGREPEEAEFEETFAWTFPQLGDAKFEYRWGGPIGVTGSFMPSADWLEEKRVAYAFAGHGVAITNMVAMAMRDLILERDSDRVRLAVIGKKPINLGPRLLRDPLVRASSAHSLRQDDTGGSTKQPLLLRLLQRLSSSPSLPKPL